MSHIQFYITLPSDSSMNCYTENTVAKFTTQLPQPVTLEGEYEVGLAEIIFPQTWYNIRNVDREYWVAIGEFAGSVLKRCFIESCNYIDASDFVDSLNGQMTNTFKDIENIRPEFIYNKSTRKIQYRLNKVFTGTTAGQRNGLTFIISETLQSRLGITNYFANRHLNTLYSAEAEFVLNDDLHLMFVYCDVASHTIVGDTSAPLLRVINLNSERGEMKRLSFPDIHYIPVQKRHFGTVEISINTARGRVMPFESGRSVVTLHFRRVFNLFQK